MITLHIHLSYKLKKKIALIWILCYISLCSYKLCNGKTQLKHLKGLERKKKHNALWLRQIQDFQWLYENYLAGEKWKKNVEIDKAWIDLSDCDR